MSRPPRPWFWSQKSIWCVTLDGERIKLSKDEAEARQIFHEIMAKRVNVKNLKSDALVIIIDELLTWTKKNRAAGTYRFYQEHAQQFIDWLKDCGRTRIRSHELTVDIFEDYLEEVSPGRRTGAVQMIKRVYNWATKRRRRETHVKGNGRP